MHPDSVTDWLNKFSKRHNRPHINPHAFRHTMASMLVSGKPHVPFGLRWIRVKSVEKVSTLFQPFPTMW